MHPRSHDDSAIGVGIVSIVTIPTADAGDFRAGTAVGQSPLTAGQGHADCRRGPVRQR